MLSSDHVTIADEFCRSLTAEKCLSDVVSLQMRSTYILGSNFVEKYIQKLCKKLKESIVLLMCNISHEPQLKSVVEKRKRTSYRAE